MCLPLSYTFTLPVVMIFYIACRSALPLLFAVIRRGNAGFFVELAAKMGDILITAVGSDLGDGQVCVFQQCAGMVDPLLDDVILGGHPSVFPEHLPEPAH